MTPLGGRHPRHSNPAGSLFKGIVMAELWQINLGYAWQRLRSEGGYTWAGWRCVESAFGGWVVVDANDKQVIKTDLKPLAEMVAGLPELMEPDLRSTTTYVRTEGGQRRQIPSPDAIGTQDVQEAYDRGYRDGWDHGAADMETALNEELDTQTESVEFIGD